MKFLIVGAGLTGAVIARILADGGHKCLVLEEADFVAGNCHTKNDKKTGILMHCFGPHTLHSDNQKVWSFLERFVEIHPYNHRKQAWVKGELYPFPINLTAINKFFGTNFNSEEATHFLTKQTSAYATDNPENFEQAALASVGQDLYEGYYKGYTKKQWGRNPTDLPPFIFRRLPIHLDNESNVFHHAKQGQPVGGYTLMVERILEHPNIQIKTSVAFDDSFDISQYEHIFYSGPIDRYFNWCHGYLPYRTLDFRHEHRFDSYQKCGTVNYCDEKVPYTRIAEHKHFWPWETHKNTVITYEFPRECQPGDRPYYPIRLNESSPLFEKYVKMAEEEPNISFVGRLGTYRYLDMDKAISEAIHSAHITLESLKEKIKIPTFFYSPEMPE